MCLGLAGGVEQIEHLALYEHMLFERHRSFLRDDDVGFTAHGL